MVRMAHISDSHLGASMFQLSERREDARKCLKKAVDMAMRHSPDLLVHTGDLFDSPFPSVTDVDFAMATFKEIDIPIVVIQGNHDIPYGYRYSQSPIRMFETTELVLSTGNDGHGKHLIEIDGKNVELHLFSWMRGRTLSRLMHEYTPQEDCCILLCHDIGGRFDELPVYYDYIGIGHSHNFMLRKDDSIGRPGSTCIVDWKREMGGKSKLIIADIDRQGVEFETEALNDVREFKFLTGLNVTGMGPDEINEVMKEWLNRLSRKKKGKPIIIMQVNGMVHADTENMINRNELIEYGEEKLNPLFLHIEPNWENLGPRSVTLSSPLNVEKTIQEYIEQTGELGGEDALAQYKVIMGENSND